MQIFDTHTHLNGRIAGKEQEELDLAKEMGVVAHNIVGFDKPTIDVPWSWQTSIRTLSHAWLAPH